MTPPELAAVAVGAFGVGADWASTRAALRLPGAREVGPAAARLGVPATTLLSVAGIVLLSALLEWTGSPWCALGLALVGGVRLRAAEHNLRLVGAVGRR